MPRPITSADLKGLPGLRRAARDELLRSQPVTVKEALEIPGVGRKATKHLLDLGVITDPEDVQPRGRVNPSATLERELLESNARACCVCKQRHVGLNLHHIDGNNWNTVAANLAVLCVRDHDAHHRPQHYSGPPRFNHLDLGIDAIRRHKADWERFVAEARATPPQVVAVMTGYGTEELVHSMKLVFQHSTGEIAFERVYHVHDGHPYTWIDRALDEIEWLGPGIKMFVGEHAESPEHCPCCSISLSTRLSPGLVRRHTSPTWSQHSLFSIFINPDEPSLSWVVGDEHGEASTGSLHRCGQGVLHIVTDRYEERVPIARRPSVRSQATSLVSGVVKRWKPARVLIGTGSHDEPTLIESLDLPRVWERGPGRSSSGARRRSSRRTRRG